MEKSNRLRVTRANQPRLLIRMKGASISQFSLTFWTPLLLIDFYPHFKITAGCDLCELITSVILCCDFSPIRLGDSLMCTFALVALPVSLSFLAIFN